MKKLVLETTAPFQGLPELVAYDEGLFEKEGLRIEWADREVGVQKTTELDVTSPQGVNPFTSHGRLFEQGKADMYNACEWGNYCRVQETGIKSRQLGRRAIVAYSAIVVAPDSPVYTPQQLANRTIGVPFYFGTHYIVLHLLEGFLPRDMIKLCRAPNGSRYRLASLLRGEVEATSLTEPHVTLPHPVLGAVPRHRGRLGARRRRDVRRVQPRRARSGAAHQREQARLPPLLHRSSRQGRPRGRRAPRGRSPREPARRLRTRADPARRDAAHVRLAEELGHARRDRVAVRSRQSRSPGSRARRAINIRSPSDEMVSLPVRSEDRVRDHRR